jgi:predicted unusual protein kinase regulating ubiquinone biosynthesis (AarF/ABC1/UbiB family)
MNARLRRERQIAEVVVRQGFGFLVDVAGPQRGWPFERVAGRGSVSSPERLRLALEELGPTFVKLGQILSTRAACSRPTTGSSLPSSRMRRSISRPRPLASWSVSS